MSEIYKTFLYPFAIILKLTGDNSMIKKFLLVWGFLAFGMMTNFAQETAAGNNLAAQKSEMQKLDSMIGRWSGEGWIQQGARRAEFTGTENVQRKIDGLALLVEGRFTDKKDSSKVIHETLAVLNYNPKSAIYDFHTFLVSGGRGMYPLRVNGAAYEWEIEFPGGKIIYVITIKDGVWHETGKMSRDDGKTWFQFFEMSLKKQ